jgi:hypothetical protein
MVHANHAALTFNHQGRGSHRLRFAKMGLQKFAHGLLHTKPF